MADDHQCSGACPSGANHTCSSGEKASATAAEDALQQRMKQIKHKILVLSGKGGVGKSTVAASLALMLAGQGKQVGLLDIDIHGPSVPKMLGLEGKPVSVDNDDIIPVQYDKNLKVMSMGFLLRHGDDAVIWRGPMKMNLIRQFLGEVQWGELDYLVIDLPPGTGDEPLSACQLIGEIDGAVVVTTGQEIALADVRKCISFCRQLNLPVIGVVENMSGFTCPGCGEHMEIFPVGGGEKMAQQMEVPFLGRIPIDPELTKACDAGSPYTCFQKQTPTAQALKKVIKSILQLSNNGMQNDNLNPDTKEPQTMRIAIPTAEGKLAVHFGHCQTFVLIDVDTDKKEILKTEEFPAPAHQPGLLPGWLAEREANVIIAGGMGQRAQSLFAEQNIQVITGAQSLEPESLVKQYLEGTLQTGANLCDH